MTLPSDFVSYTLDMLGKEAYDRLIEGLNMPATTSIRLNPFKVAAAEGNVSVAHEAVLWCPLGYYLEDRPAFTFDPAMHAGSYYVQEASSMFLAHVLKTYVDRPVTMIDMCAAPGGKTTLARSILPEGSVLLANEPVRTRANILSENVQKLGHEDVLVSNNYPADIARSGIQADVILCDVPCSGEGMFRKDEGAIAEWSRQHVEKCQLLQRDIVAEAWKCLRPNGLLIYSTCTFNTLENEENVKWISETFDAEILPVDPEPSWHVTPSLLPGFTSPVYRFLPGLTKGEGLFMAVMRKRGDSESGKPMKPSRNTMKAKREPAAVWLNEPDQFNFIREGAEIYAVSNRLMPLYQQAQKRLRLLLAGIPVATEKGKDLIPQQGLALSRKLKRAAFPMVQLSYQDALTYLRKEQIALNPTAQRGITAVMFGTSVLGFAKNLGNRANNLYPAEWKIRSSHLPDTYQQLINPINLT